MIKVKQSKIQDTKYGYNQYYYIKYSLFNRNSPNTKYISVVKARSINFAKEIIKLKISRDYPDSNLKINSIEMFSKQYLFQGRKLSLIDWQNIQTCAFPNISDHLFKYPY